MMDSSNATYQPQTMLPDNGVSANNNNRRFTANQPFKGRLLNLRGLIFEYEGSKMVTNSQNVRLKMFESTVIDLVVASVRASKDACTDIALARAKDSLEAFNKLRTTLAQQDYSKHQPMTTSVSLFELSLMVNSNLASMLAKAGQAREAIELYTGLCRLATSGSVGQSSNILNSNFNLDLSSNDSGTSSNEKLTVSSPGVQRYDTKFLLHKFGLNIGNIYHQLADYKRALKYYRLTLDRLSSMANLAVNNGTQVVEQSNGKESQKQHHDMRQLKLKIMNNISLSLFKQRQSKLTNNETSGGGDETLSSLKLLLADNLISRSDSTNEQPQQQVATPERAPNSFDANLRFECRNANYHKFALNLMVCMAISETRSLAEMTSALESFARVDICHQFQLAFRLNSLDTNLTSSSGAAQPTHAVQSVKDRDTNSIVACKRILRQLTILRNDKLEQLLADRDRQINKRMVFACRLICHKARNPSASELCSKIFATNKTYEHLLNDLIINEVMLSVDANKNQLDQLVSLLKKVSQQTSNLSHTAAETSCFVKLSAKSNDKNECKEAESLASRTGMIGNLANCYFLNNDFESSINLYRTRVISEEKARWQPNYNLAIIKRRMLEHPRDNDNNHTSDELNVLQGTRKITRRLLSKNMTLSSLQALDAEATLKEILRANNQPPEVYLMLSRLESESDNNGTDKANVLLQEANRMYSFHLPILERLVALNIKNFNYKVARELIVNCTKNRPDDVRWYQMMAECYRREADYKRATRIYKLAIDRFPQDTNCLRALIKLAQELGLESQRIVYEEKLNKVLTAGSEE